MPIQNWILSGVVIILLVVLYLLRKERAHHFVITSDQPIGKDEAPSYAC